MNTTIDHPYTGLRGGHWLRGNLHTHTTRSDGALDPQQVIDRYSAAGYDFLAITDHDKLATAKDYKAWKANGLVLIPGNEITRSGPHLLHIDARRQVEPSAQRQLAINDALKAGGFVVVNHPNWGADFNHCPLERMREWVGPMGMEIFNGTIHHLQGNPVATDKWDMLLSSGRRLWALANDDCHGQRDFALGWNMVYAARRNVASIVQAMLAGRFYPSTGVRIERLEVRRDTITLHAPDARRIIAVGSFGRRLQTVDADTIAYQHQDKSPYVRFECVGDREAMAWTQPFFFRNEPAES